jgi:hypothetical protein
MGRPLARVDIKIDGGELLASRSGHAGFQAAGYRERLLMADLTRPDLETARPRADSQGVGLSVSKAPPRSST